MNYRCGWIGCVGWLLASPVIAEDTSTHERGFYGGVGLAYRVLKLDADDLNQATWVVDNPAETSVDNETYGYVAYAGFRIMRYLALDVAYADLGTAEYRLGGRLEFAPVTGSCVAPCRTPAHLGPTQFTYEASVIRFGVLGSLPIGEKWSVQGRLGLGIQSWQVRDDVGGERSDAENVGVIGIGVAYAIASQWRLNLDWEQYEAFSVASASGSSSDNDAVVGALSEPPLTKSITLAVEYRL